MAVRIGWRAVGRLMPASGLRVAVLISIAVHAALLVMADSRADRPVPADEPVLAPVLEETARAVFLAAHFEPGQRDGVEVKSLIKIEVVFDNTASTAPAASVVSSQLL